MLKKTLFQKLLLKRKLSDAVILPLGQSIRQISDKGPGNYSQSYVCGPGPNPLIGENLDFHFYQYSFHIHSGNTIGDLIDIGADKWGNEREALVSVHQVGFLLQDILIDEYLF